MSNTDLVSAYLENQMSGAEQLAFEKQLASNSNLQQELGFQKDVIEGVKAARRAELKTMLNNVSVGGASGGTMMLGKIAAGITIIGAVAAGWYLYNKDDSAAMEQSNHNPVIAESMPTEESQEAVSNPDPIEEVTTDKVVEESTKEVATTKKKLPTANVEKSVEAVEPTLSKPEINKPVTSDFESSDETTDSLLLPGSSIGSGAPKETLLALDVEIDNTKRKYSFHYQFKNGRLFLFGDFEKELYEILEFNKSKGKSLFLYYKDNYYTLNENQKDIKPLEEVKELSLIDKLKKARQSN